MPSSTGHPHHGLKHGGTQPDPTGECLRCNIEHARLHPSQCGRVERLDICIIHDRAQLTHGLLTFTGHRHERMRHHHARSL